MIFACRRMGSCRPAAASMMCIRPRSQGRTPASSQAQCLSVHQQACMSCCDIFFGLLQAVIRTQTLTCNELLRHLWSCFPPTSKALQTKAARLRPALDTLCDRYFACVICMGQSDISQQHSHLEGCALIGSFQLAFVLNSQRLADNDVAWYQ